MKIPFNKERVVVIGSGFLIVVSLCFIGGLLYLKKQAEVPPIAGVPGGPDPKLIAETEQRKKEKILALREKWRVWAVAHQKELRSMLQAQPNNTGPLQSVVAAIPPIPTKKETGLDLDDFSGLKNLSDPVVDNTQYTHFDPPVNGQTPEQIKEEQKWTRMIRAEETAGFNQMRDIVVVSSSSAWSNKSYCLWATGKVTESKYPTPRINKTYKIVSPSYDFLTS